MEETLKALAAKLIELSDAVKPLLVSKDAPAIEIVELWKAAGTAYTGHWTFYVLGTTAILGFVFSEKFVQIPTEVRKALLALFALFLAASFVSVVQNLLPYNAATKYLRSWIGKTNTDISDSIYITYPWVVVLLHLAVDACAIRIVWLRANQPTIEVATRS